MPVDKAAFRAWTLRIRDVLNRDWDPIGVFRVKRQWPDGTPVEWPDDEYERYAGKLASMLSNGSSDEELLAYLKWAEVENMALSPPFDSSRGIRVVKALRGLRLLH